MATRLPEAFDENVKAKAIERLQRIGFDVNADFDAALLKSAKQGDDAVMRLLLDIGVNIQTKDGKGCTSLWIAAWCGHEKVIELLLDPGTECRGRV